ncbi:MAG: HEAT repeat domain-containing protein [Planctomycetota bacterium]
MNPSASNSGLGIYPESDDEDWIVAPQHIFISPEGEVLSSVPYQITVGELEWMMLHAIRMLDPDFEWKETGRMRAPRRLKMKETEKAEASKKPPSRKEVEAIIKRIKKESFGYYGAIDKLPIIVRHQGKQARNYTKRVLGAFETADSQRCNVLRIIGRNSPRSWWNVLTPFLSHESESVREAAALALRDLGESKSIKSLNRRWKKEKSIPVKGRILEAMAAAGPADWRPRGLLAKVLAGEKNESLRVRATLASGMLEDRETVTGNLARALGDPSAKVRASAAYAIAVRRDRELLPHLRQRLEKEPDSSVKHWLEEARKVVEGATLAAFEKFLAEVLGEPR